MAKTDPRVDAYIAKAAAFARPILKHLRKLVHSVCPGVTETIKWRTPFFEYQGILLATPAFKQHCALIFWKGGMLFRDFPAKGNPRKKLRRITSATDLPGDKVLTGYVKKAMELNEAGIKSSMPAKLKAKKEVVAPDYFLAALRRNRNALATFENFSPSCRREYVEWIVEARREETRAKRIQTALEWMAKGKSRHWKYQ